LTAEADHHLALFILGLQIHDAGGRVIGQPEGEPAVGIRAYLMLLVERNRRLTRLAQPSDDPQLPARDHGLIDDDVCHRGSAAGDEDGAR